MQLRPKLIKIDGYYNENYKHITTKVLDKLLFLFSFLIHITILQYYLYKLYNITYNICIRRIKSFRWFVILKYVILTMFHHKDKHEFRALYRFSDDPYVPTAHWSTQRIFKEDVYDFAAWSTIRTWQQDPLDVPRNTTLAIALE